MSNPYNDVNFGAFSEVPEKKMTGSEQKRIIKNFYQKAGFHNKQKSQRRAWTAAVAACLVLCMVATPIGDATWAAVKQALVGIGDYLGVVKQDDYATVVDQTQTKNGITVTLNDAIGSDNELRVSVTGQHEDGTPLKATAVEIEDLTINGINRYSGFGTFGSDKYDLKEMHFMGTDFTGFDNFKMPLNANIEIKILADSEHFDFAFTLDNDAFKKATRYIDIDKTLVSDEGRELKLKQLIITPIDQIITVEDGEKYAPYTVSEEGEQMQTFEEALYMKGTDNFGNKIYFSWNYKDRFDGLLDNNDGKGYTQLNQDVSSYYLKVYHGKTQEYFGELNLKF